RRLHDAVGGHFVRIVGVRVIRLRLDLCRHDCFPQLRASPAASLAAGPSLARLLERGSGTMPSAPGVQFPESRAIGELLLGGGAAGPAPRGGRRSCSAMANPAPGV